MYQMIHGKLSSYEVARILQKKIIHIWNIDGTKKFSKADGILDKDHFEPLEDIRK